MVGSPGATSVDDGGSSIAVVCDAGPLISLARLDLLGVLRGMFRSVQVPAEVIEECMARPGNLDAQRIAGALSSGLLEACEAPPLVLPGLDLGECAAISRALEVGAVLLVDDRAARQQASAMGLRVTGTLGVLVRARRMAQVGPLRPLIDALRDSGQRLAQPVVDYALREVGELPP